MSDLTTTSVLDDKLRAAKISVSMPEAMVDFIDQQCRAFRVGPRSARSGRLTSVPGSSAICNDRPRLDVVKQIFFDMAHEYLVIFQYHEPEPRQLFERGVIEDYESTTGVFIAAESAEDA